LTCLYLDKKGEILLAFFLPWEFDCSKDFNISFDISKHGVFQKTLRETGVRYLQFGWDKI